MSEQIETGEKRAEDFDVKRSPWWKKYLISFVIGLVMTGLLMVGRGAFSDGKTMAERMSVCSDACFFTGVMLAGIGLLVFVSGEGAFDMLAYAVKLGFTLLFRTEHESYIDYKMRKAAKKTAYGFLLLTGIVFLLAAGLFTGLFYAFS